MIIAHCRTWILGRNLKNLESKKSTPKDMENGEKKLKNVENEKRTL
jgi:hypothetical protein